MDEDAICSFCERPATAGCGRCGRAYCDQHGDRFCDACLEPASALPSATLYRSAVIAWLVCVLLAVWFLLGTPRVPGEPVRASDKAHAAATPNGQRESGGTSSSPVPPAARTASATAVAGSRDYAVQGGDTLASIAAAAGVPASAILQLNPGIDAANLQIGQIVHLPPKPP